MVAFNLARLLEVRSRPAAARRWWQAVVDRPGRLPAWVLEAVCPRLAEPRSRPACLGGPTTVAAPPGRWPLSGNRLESVESGLAGLDPADWEAQRFDWFADQLSGRILTRVDGGAMVLELDRFVQMQVLRKDLPGGPDMLVPHCPSGLDRREVAAGRILSCGNWAALLSDGGVRELWWLAR